MVKVSVVVVVRVGVRCAWGSEGGLVFGVGAGAGSVLVMRLGLGGKL